MMRSQGGGNDGCFKDGQLVFIPDEDLVEIESNGEVATWEQIEWMARELLRLRCEEKTHPTHTLATASPELVARRALDQTSRT